MAINIEKVEAQVYTWIMQEYFALVAMIGFIYYYLTTLDQEVDKIWSQKWKMGKFLFLLTQYTALSRIAFDLPINWRLHITLSLKTCRVLGIIYPTLSGLTSQSAEASLWLCLYALMGAKRLYFVLLVVVWLCLSVSNQVLLFLNYSRRNPVPISQLDRELGYACTFKDGNWLFDYSSYILLARTCFATGLGVITAFVRYRKNNGQLIKVIRRDGGVYYLSTLAIRIADVVRTLPSAPRSSDPYNIGQMVMRLIIPIFANRLLLNMKTIDDSGTRSIVSTLIFADSKPNRGQDEGESIDTEGLSDTVDVSTVEAARTDPEKSVDGRKIDNQRNSGPYVSQ